MNDFLDYKMMMSRLYERALEYIKDHPRIITELEDAECYLGDLKISGEERRAIIVDWFLYDAVSESLSENFLEHLLKTDVFTDAEKNIYRRLRQGVYSIFLVKAVQMGKKMIVRDLLGGNREYEVTETTFTRDAVKGDCVMMRVLPFQDYFILAGRGYVFPRETSPALQLFLGENSGFLGERLTPLSLWRIFREQNRHERLPPEERLVLIGMECGMDRADMDALIERMKAQAGLEKGSSVEIMQEFLHQIHPSRHFSLEELSETFIEVWNGFIARGNSSAVKGPLEQMLIRALIGYVQLRIKPEDYPDAGGAEAAAQTLCDRWFIAPREELGGRAPRDLILEERAALGNPQKEVGFSIQFNKVEPGRNILQRAEKLFEEGTRMLEGKKFGKALAAYQGYCGINPDNHVVWHNMAVARFNMGHRKKARECLERALAIKPDYKMALEKMKLLGEMEEAPAQGIKHKEEKYKRSSKAVISLTITLSDVAPAVWRRVEVPPDITLFRLAAVLTCAMGWTGYHLHQFIIDEEYYGLPEEEFADDLEIIDERNVRLQDIVDQGVKTFVFEYDFGDGWEHAVKIGKMAEPEKGVKYPRVTAGARQCPPEDCGGPGGYENFLEAISDKKHPGYKAMRKWIGRDFDPEEFDLGDFDDFVHDVKVMEKQWKDFD